MLRLGTMLAAMLVVLTAGATAHAKMEMRTFPVLAGLARTTSILHSMVQSGSPRNLRASSAGWIPGPASRI